MARGGWRARGPTYPFLIRVADQDDPSHRCRRAQDASWSRTIPGRAMGRSWFTPGISTSVTWA